MNKSLIIIAVLLGIFTIWYYIRNPLTATVTINNTTYNVDVAVTPREKELGLGGRKSLPQNKGMLFGHDHKEQFSYWMKGMNFPIDIIWIRDNQIVDISHSVPVVTGSYFPSYQPRESVNKVLEINAGEAKLRGFVIGDLVHISD